MKIFCGVIFALVLASCLPAHATSLKEYQAESPEAQGRFVADFVNKMATDLSVKNPQLGRAIVEYFTVTPPGKELPEGVATLGHRR